MIRLAIFELTCVPAQRLVRLNIPFLKLETSFNVEQPRGRVNAAPFGEFLHIPPNSCSYEPTYQKHMPITIWTMIATVIAELISTKQI